DLLHRDLADVEPAADGPAEQAPEHTERVRFAGLRLEEALESPMIADGRPVRARGANPHLVSLSLDQAARRFAEGHRGGRGGGGGGGRCRCDGGSARLRWRVATR